ncbi:MAG: hypothetical protein K2H45_11175, partial [Acetatifactor sp.]|nr:hypothetical protein [Acetatifactor sp.]
MLRAENVQNDKVMNALEGLRLNTKELELAEKYLKGEVTEEALADMRFQNMINMSQDQYKPFQALFESYFKKKRYEEAARLLRLLYAISAYTCSECLEYNYIRSFKQAVEKGGMQIEQSMVLALYAQHLYRYGYRYGRNYIPSRFISTYDLESLAEFANHDPAIVRKALQDFDRHLANGNILLYTLYFYLCYNREEPTLLPQDEDLLKEYENILVDLLEESFVPNASINQEIRKIQESIRRGGLQENKLQGIRKQNIDGAAFMAVSSCAFVNYMLSAKLHDVMRVCGAAAPARLLDAMEILDPRGEFERIGGNLGELFGITSQSIMA